MSYVKKLQVIFIVGTCTGTAVAAAAGVTMPLAIFVGVLIGAVAIRVLNKKIEGERT